MDNTTYMNVPPQIQGIPQPLIETLYSGFMQKGTSDLIRWQLDAKDILDEFKHKMKGEVWSHTDAEGNDIYIPAGIPLMNDEGINSILSLISARISKVMIMSNFDDKDIQNIMLPFSFELIILFLNKYQQFGIDKAFLSSITNYIEDLVYATAKRALNEGERNFLGTTEKRIETYNESPQQRGGFWNLFKKGS